MSKERKLSPLPLFDEASLMTHLQDRGIKTGHAMTLWSHVIRNPEVDLDEIPDLPMAMRNLLQGPDTQFARMTSKIVENQVSRDGTVKLLVELQDGKRVECVIIKHEKESTRRPGEMSRRTTLCVSSQVGCAMACTFCATGTMGLMGNLLAGEILEQLIHASAFAKISNVVFMGMGEPLHNYDAVISAVKMMADGKLFNLSKNRITVSTVGIIPRMRQLTREAPFVTLALSLHAPTQELRTQIVPSAKTYRLDELMAALDGHVADSDKRRVLVEYVMLSEVNDSDEVAHQLGALLQGRKVHLNLIPYNPTDVIVKYKKPPQDRTLSFFQILIGAPYNIFTTIRAEHGSDIAGACGQLAVQKGTAGCDSKDCATEHKHEHKTHASTCDSKTQDIEDLIHTHSSTSTKKKTISVTPATSAASPEPAPTASAAGAGTSTTAGDSTSTETASNVSAAPSSATSSLAQDHSNLVRYSLLVLLLAVGLTLAVRLLS